MRSQYKKKSDIEKLRDGGLRIWHIIVIIILFIIMIWSFRYAYNNRKGIGTELIYKAYNNDLILNGAFAEHVNIGGLTKKQAEEKINEQYVYPITKCVITFTDQSGDYKRDYTVGELGLSYDVKGLVDKAYKLGRSGSKQEIIASVNELGDRREFLTPQFHIDEGKIHSVVNEINRDLSGTGIKMNKDILEKSLYTMLEDMTVMEAEDRVVTIPEIS